MQIVFLLHMLHCIFISALLMFLTLQMYVLQIEKTQQIVSFINKKSFVSSCKKLNVVFYFPWL
jgi:uncharacterized membrane protein YdfJ with MMPL/SSD domain